MMSNKNPMVEMAGESKKFIRRADLTPMIRLYIAFTAIMAQSGAMWGKITELSRQYAISRMFVYMLAATLEQHSLIIFGDNRCNPAAVVEERLPYYYILSLRLEGRCSIEATSTIMKRFDLDMSSTGSISQFLQSVGSLLPDTLTPPGNKVQLVVFLSDELFSKSVPILITVDPISSAILKIELADTRKVDDWKRHWQCLEKNGYMAIYLVSDEGKSLCQAQKEALADVIRQPDTYHAIAHKLGNWVNILENAAYKAIDEEYDSYDKLDSAKSEEVINKRIEKCEKAQEIAREKIDLYESYYFLYLYIVEQLQLFDSNGNLRDRKEAEANIELALELVESLGIEKLNKAVGKVRRTMPGLLNYFDRARSIVTTLTALPIEPKALQALCLAWQWRKGMIKSKKAKARQCCNGNEERYLEIAEGYLQEDYDLMKEHVYTALDRITQSSALVECINSIIRPYLNTSKNQITQETLNLIMFYHNHRRYKDGKRKGKTPIEILTGEKQNKDWIELLFEVVEEKAPALFTPSR
jgi:hypothetical protein